LERRLGQIPRNSNKLPSSEGYDKPAPRSRRERANRTPGGQPGHEGRTLRQIETPDERVVHRPVACAGCGSSLDDTPVISTEVRQVFDLPEIVLRAVATYLLDAQHLPLARTAELLAEIVGASISPGSLAGWYADAAADLDGVDAALRAGLAGADVFGADETGIRVDGALAWVHAARTDTLTRYTVSDQRGKDAMLAAGVLPALSPQAVLVTDFWSPYWDFDVVHAVCGAHLGRELVAAAEVPGQDWWASGVDRLLIEINRTVAAARETAADALAAELLATYRRRYGELIDAGWAANPGHHPGGRGKTRRPKHVNLLDRLDGHRDEVRRYCHDLQVPFTNNGSEQTSGPGRSG
jgi:transposase